MRTEERKKISIAQMTTAAMMTAITCILGPVAVPIPVSPVPVSLTNMVIFFMVYLLGMKWGTVSCLLYLLIGLAGLPVFSGFTGGIGKLMGPTGGYLIGFIFLALIAGYFVDRFRGNVPMYVAGMITGMMVTYLFGTLWLARQLGVGFAAGLGAGVIPYLPGDGLKIAAAAIAGPKIKRSLDLAGRVK